jgi:hypothetical protein
MTMEITSGGTGGPELDPVYADMGTDFAGSLLEPARLREFVEALHGAGWRVRKCSWTEYEASCAWAELLLIPSGTFSGVVAPGHRERLLALVAELGFACRADPEDEF